MGSTFPLRLEEYDPELKQEYRHWVCMVRMSDKALANLVRHLVKFHGELLSTHCFGSPQPSGRTGHMTLECLIKLPKGLPKRPIWHQFWSESGIKLRHPTRISPPILRTNPNPPAVQEAYRSLFKDVDRDRLHRLPTRSYRFNGESATLSVEGDYEHLGAKVNRSENFKGEPACYSHLAHFYHDQKMLQSLLDGDLLDEVMESERPIREEAYNAAY